MTVTQNAIKATAVFLREWARNPLEVAAVTPSSTGLARLMASEISSETGPVLEIGPGTGAFTAQLLANGVAPQDLTMLEKNSSFVRMLKREFPAVRVVNTDVAEVDLTTLTCGRPYGAVVSGLGLPSMEQRVVAGMLRRIFQHMSGDGAFYQFTYGLRCPVPARLMRALGLRTEKLGSIWWNCPPAAVYRISRAAGHRRGSARSWRS
ncbi:MAG: rRNA adenine N-6-methyltransferase family protein [Pseudomonadota bacterium]